MTEDTTLQGFTIYYPDQVPDQVPVPYPWWVVPIPISIYRNAKLKPVLYAIKRLQAKLSDFH